MSKKTGWPQLYATASTGKVKTWQISVEEGPDGVGLLTVVHGYIDGKLQSNTKTIRQGKNIGRSNETNPYDQACSEAESAWKRKRDSGYGECVPSVGEVSSKETELEGRSEVILPMLALKFKERKHDIKWPALVQPKLNGVRCLARSSGDRIIYQSRRGKEFPELTHLSKELKPLIEACGTIDGELFTRELTFQEITSAIKKPKETTPLIEYWIYDIVSDADFIDRTKMLMQYFIDNSDNCQKIGNLVRVETWEVADEDEVQKYHQRFSIDYEGTMIRNMAGGYTIKHRSKNLQKLKDFIDEEFEIIGGKSGTGLEEGCVTFIVRDNKRGTEFDARPRGSRKIRRKWLKDIDKLVGKQLTVRYQYLSDDNIPIFPVGLAIRDYE